MDSHKKLGDVVTKGIKLSERMDHAARIHGKTAYAILFRLIMISVVLIAVGVLCNLKGYLFVNMFLSFISLIAGVLIFTHPEILITLVDIDIINKSLPDNMQIDVLDDIFQQFIKTSKRVVALCCITFLFLGIVPIDDNISIFGILFMSVMIILLIDINQKREKK